MSNRDEHMQSGGNRSMQVRAGMAVPRIWITMITMGVLIAMGSVLFFAQPARQAVAMEMTVYKSPSCNCCDKWVDHMRDAGYKVTTKDSTNMDNVKSHFGIMPGLRSCHTAVVDGYVVEGHVPAADIKRLLEERPDVSGLAAPGMPMGSPGMEGPYADQYNVLAFNRTGWTAVYARY